MKLTAKSCPTEIETDAFLLTKDGTGPSDSGATLVFAEWAHGRRKQVVVRVNDYTLRRLADLIEDVAAAREHRAAFLRRKS